MKKSLMFLAIGMLMVSAAHAKHEVKKEAKANAETQVQEVIDTVSITPFSETARVVTRIYYLDENDVALRKEKGNTYIYKNRSDDPKTPEDETSTAYDDFISGSQIKFDKIIDELNK